MLHLSFTKQFSLLSAQWSVVLFLNRQLEQIHISWSRRSWTLGQQWSSKFYISLPIKMPRNLQFSAVFAKNSLFKTLGRMWESSLYSKRPLFHTIPCKFLVHQTACFVGLYFFEGRNDHPWASPSKKPPNTLWTFIYVGSISSTIQDRLLQKWQYWKWKAV